MASFAIICEGVSESNCLHAIVDKMGKSDGDFADIQPEMTQNHGRVAQNSSGGWTEVLSHCNMETFQTALQTNDYLIVQIDTDRCHEPGFDVPKLDANNKPRSEADIYQDVINRILRDIEPAFFAANKDRIIFAICFDEIECWFLPVFFVNDKKKACSTHNCIFHLNTALSKKNTGLGIPQDKKNMPQVLKAYQYIFKQIKRKDIPDIASCNFGFDAFFNQLCLIPDIEE